jgi:23S rRNA pseudouridine2605 synthase
MAERLQKFLAQAGIASRRSAEKLIAEGRVSVNRRRVVELGTKVDPAQDLVTVDGRRVVPREIPAYFVLYKPAGVVTTLRDPQGRPSVGDLLRGRSPRLFPVGRLDYDAEGALIATSDGELAHRLSHPRFGVPRLYLVKVKGHPSPQVVEQLRRGVKLEEGLAKPLSAQVYRLAERNCWLSLQVAEGRSHLIKRLCAAVGHPVLRLFRFSYAGIGVEGLKAGEARQLEDFEVEQLHAVAEGQPAPAAAALFLPPRRHRAEKPSDASKPVRQSRLPTARATRARH